MCTGLGSRLLSAKTERRKKTHHLVGWHRMTFAKQMRRKAPLSLVSRPCGSWMQGFVWSCTSSGHVLCELVYISHYGLFLPGTPQQPMERAMRTAASSHTGLCFGPFDVIGKSVETLVDGFAESDVQETPSRISEADCATRSTSASQGVKSWAGRNGIHGFERNPRNCLVKLGCYPATMKRQREVKRAPTADTGAEPDPREILRLSCSLLREPGTAITT